LRNVLVKEFQQAD